MEIIQEDIVIVGAGAGAGISGLSASLGFHRLGLRSLVLESYGSLRVTGFALTVWSNAWRALDALKVGDALREDSLLLQGFQFGSLKTGLPLSEVLIDTPESKKHESRCIKRRNLLETMAKELPKGTIRYSSKVVSIEESGRYKLVHLADGSVIQAKVLIGADGINSVVGKWLGLPKPIRVGRLAFRGFAYYSDAHNFQPLFYSHFGGGVKFGFAPCDDKSVFWFCTLNPANSNWHEEMGRNPSQMKEFVLSKIIKASKEVQEIVEKTNLQSIFCAELKMRWPLDLLLKPIAKGNICVAGDALHPMTPDLGQGGCSSLEDGVILSRCIGEAFKKILKGEIEDEIMAIEKGVEEYAKCRKWRGFSLITTSCVIGMVQESDNVLVSFLREKVLSRFTGSTMMRMSEYNCGKLDA